MILAMKPELASIADKEGSTPLHDACKREDSLEVVRLLLQSSCDSAARDKEKGRTPLHNAIFWSSSAGVVEALVRANPELIVATDDEGLTPLDYLVYFYTAELSARHMWEESLSSMEAISEVLRAFFAPEPLRPSLHVALHTRGCPMLLLQFLVFTNPEDCRSRDGSGNFPLNIAVELLLEDDLGYIEMLQELIAKYPQATKNANAQGRLPLICMTKNHSWSRGIGIVLEAHPAAVVDLDLDDWSFCVLLAKLDQNVMFCLFQEAPFLISPDEANA